MARGLDVRPQVNPKALAPSTDRTFALLELLSQSPDGLSIAQITRELGVAQNSVFRITKTLEARGYLTRRDRDKCYLLTDKLLHIAQPKAAGKNLVEESLPVMKQLRDETTESVVLTVRCGHEAALILQIPALNVMKILWDLGVRTPLYNNAPGKVFLALADETTCAASDFAARVHALDGTDHHRQARVGSALGQSPGAGVCRGSRRVYRRDSLCRGSGLFGDGEVAATICVSGPAARIPVKSFDAQGRQVIAAADRITERLPS